MRWVQLDHEHLDVMSQVGAGIVLVAVVGPDDDAVTAAALHNFDKIAWIFPSRP
jgi:hypothetical protein